MEETIKKFRFKGPGIIINAPEPIQEAFEKAGFKTAFGADKSTDTVIFINNQQEFLHFLNNELSKVQSDSVLWFAYPKGTSKVKTDINRDTIAATGEQFGITTVAAISIDATWSGLRFRPIDKVGK